MSSVSRDYLGLEHISSLYSRISDPEDPASSPSYVLNFPAYPNDSFRMLRQRCGRGEWSSTTLFRANEEGVEGDRGGWRWRWFS